MLPEWQLFHGSSGKISISDHILSTQKVAQRDTQLLEFRTPHASYPSVPYLKNLSNSNKCFGTHDNKCPFERHVSIGMVDIRLHSTLIVGGFLILVVNSLTQTREEQLFWSTISVNRG